ncbi:MAG: histidine--tRNA ligase [bacterium]
MGRRPKNKLENSEPVKLQIFKTPSILRGMKDILPIEQPYWNFIYDIIENIAKKYDYQKIEFPILEEKNLFQRTIGKQTTLVSKELFCFTDSGNMNVCLRPEATSSAVRAYIKHGMHALLQPVKMYYVGPMFRYERPQSGVYRQFNQFGFEALGQNKPIIDAQLLLICHNFFNNLNIKVSLKINSIGCLACRPNYTKELTKFLKNKKSRLCVECKKWITKDPLRIFTCEDKNCHLVREECPQIIDWLCEDCKSHFVNVLEYLDDLETPYELNPYLVRNFGYYTKTIFEIHPLEESGTDPVQNALGAGGRYDNLIEILDGKPTGASGFAIGIERVIHQIKKQNLFIPQSKKPVVFLAQLGEDARRKSLTLFEQFSKENIYTIESLSTDSLKEQLEMATKRGVKFTLILGQKEVMDNTILLRDMEGGMQEIIDFKKIIPELKKKIEENKK